MGIFIQHCEFGAERSLGILLYFDPKGISHV